MKVTLPILNGYSVTLKFTKHAELNITIIEGTIRSSAGSSAGEFKGRVLDFADFDDYDAMAETCRAYVFFTETWKHPKKLRDMRLSSPLPENTMLYLQRVTVKKEHRGQDLGANTIRKVIEYCHNEFGIHAAFGQVFPLQHEDPENEDAHSFSAKDRNEDMRSLTNYYSRTLGPKVAWAGDYMILPIRGEIPRSMEKWKPAKTSNVRLTRKAASFLEGEVWVILSHIRSVVAITKNPEQYIGDPSYRVSRYIDGVEEGDLGLAIPDGITLLVKPSEITRQPVGTPILRWASPDEIAKVEVLMREPAKVDGKPTPIPLRAETVTFIGRREGLEHGVATTLREALSNLCYSVIHIGRWMKIDADAYEKRGVSPQPPTPEQKKEYEKIAAL